MKRKNKQKKSDGIKEVKNILIGLSVLILIALFYRMGNERAIAEAETWKQRAIEAEKVIEDVEKVEREMKRFIPKEDKRKKEAVIFVGKARAFGLPLKVAMVSAEAETCYNMRAVGPFGERGTHQAMYFTMRNYFPDCNGDLIYWEVASWLHLRECYERSGRNLFLTVAYHNSGMHRSADSAYRVAWKHVSRCRRIARGLSV